MKNYYPPTLPSGHWTMFICVPFQLPGENRASFLLPGTHLHLSQVKQVRVNVFPLQGHNIETMSQRHYPPSN